ncbi:MAG: peptidylprolyl isomerase, partial [Bacteroidetes bacterium]|nr:peptidylprolyl isomerase [Bacteroidota bacterium]
SPTFSEEFIYIFKKNHSGKQDFTEAKVNEYLDLFVNFKLKITEAHNRGYDTTAKFAKELKTYGDELKKPYRAEKDLLDKLTKEAYDHLKQEVKASHILVGLKPEATPDDTLKAFNKISDIEKRISNGEDFEKLARELSEDPSAKYNGGNLGYFTAMQMVYPFEEAAYKTKVGEISPIVHTRFGYHLIKVLDKTNSRGEVEVSHILLRTSKESEAKTKNQIFEIYDQLKNGRSWDDLCKEFSEDSNTKNAGGRLRPFGVGALASVPEFEATSFALQKPGEISDPFQSGIGWHIIRLEKKIPVPPYSEVEASLKKRVARDERLKISEQAAAVKRKIDLGFSENAVNKSKVLASADSSLLKGQWKFKGGDDLKKGSLFSVGNKNFTVGDFINWVEKKQISNKLSPSNYINQLFNSFSDEKINEAEEEKIIRENPDFQHLMTEYREGILLFEIMEKEIWNKASEDSIGQKKFYNENVDKYKAGPRVEARIFSTTDKSFLEEMKKKISKGDTLKAADMKKFKSVQHFRNYEKGESKVIDKINWVPGLQETEMDGTYYLVEVSHLVEAGTKKFTESRAQVISSYQDSLEKSWVASLKKKYPVKVNNKGKNAVMEELLKK